MKMGHLFVMTKELFGPVIQCLIVKLISIHTQSMVFMLTIGFCTLRNNINLA